MWILFEIIIFGFLIADGVVIIKTLRRLFAKFSLKHLVFLLFAAFCWFVIFYGSFIESNKLAIESRTVKLSDSASHSIRAAVISDLHVGRYKKDGWANRVADEIMRLSPDVIFMAGDFVFDDAYQAKFLYPLAKLKAKYGVFAILGNHDYGNDKKADDGSVYIDTTDTERVDAITQALQQAGIKILVNSGEKISVDGAPVYILGTDELWTRRANVKKAIESFGTTTAPYPNILLTHNPDIVKTAQAEGLNLVIAGHTHGGQIRLPWIGPVPPIPDRLGRKYDRGLFEFGKTQLFITSGLGEIGPRARLFNPPEIALLDIRF